MPLLQAGGFCDWCGTGNACCKPPGKQVSWSQGLRSDISLEALVHAYFGWSQLRIHTPHNGGSTKHPHMEEIDVRQITQYPSMEPCWMQIPHDRMAWLILTDTHTLRGDVWGCVDVFVIVCIVCIWLYPYISDIHRSLQVHYWNATEETSERFGSQVCLAIRHLQARTFWFDNPKVHVWPLLWHDQLTETRSSGLAPGCATETC